MINTVAENIGSMEPAKPRSVPESDALTLWPAPTRPLSQPVRFP